MSTKQQVEQSLLQYIETYRVDGGTLLPDTCTLAKILNCDESRINTALQSAQDKHILRRDDLGNLILIDPPPNDTHSMFSFTASADHEGTDLLTVIDDVSTIKPADSAYDAEATKSARRALFLSNEEDIVLISRIRTIEGEPRVLHRAYIDPKRFPDSFLQDHNFSKISLIQTYQTLGFTLLHRDTRLISRLPTAKECDLFRCQDNEPLLDAKQSLFATTADQANPFVLEFLHATYKRWTYRIQNRLARVPK